MNKSVSQLLASLGMALVLLNANSVAIANNRAVDWTVSIGTPYAYPPTPVYVQPPPIYYTPQPIYVQPAPVYLRPRPVVIAPYPVIYSPYPGPYARDYGWRRYHHRHPHYDRD